MSDWLLSPGSGLGRLFPKEFRTPPPSSSRPGLGTLAKKVRGTGEPGPPGGPCGKSAVSFPVHVPGHLVRAVPPRTPGLSGEPLPSVASYFCPSFFFFFFFPKTLFIPHDAQRALYDHVRP